MEKKSGGRAPSGSGEQMSAPASARPDPRGGVKAAHRIMEVALRTDTHAAAHNQSSSTYYPPWACAKAPRVQQPRARSGFKASLGATLGARTAPAPRVRTPGAPACCAARSGSVGNE